jgi:hypothetical protein
MKQVKKKTFYSVLKIIITDIYKTPMSIINLFDSIFGRINRNRLVIVTASDYTHGKSLLNLISSIIKHEPQALVYVYDLGLTEEQSATLRMIAPKAVIKSFDYKKYPEWFNIKVNAGQYAWKPVVIHEVLHASDCPVVWMDAGNILYSKLNHVYGRVVRSGFYSISSDGDLAKWTHEETLKFFGFDKKWAKGKRNVNGAFIAFDPRQPEAVATADEWARCAQVREAIAPEGSSRENHRQDQALLGVIAHKRKMVGNFKEFCTEFRIQRDVD